MGKLPDKKKDEEEFNSSFMTVKNIKWFHFASQYVPHKSKPLVFLPCGRSSKNRKKYGRKFISQSMSHQFMSSITRNNSIDKIILSEPLTIIPYEIEGHELRPDYNIPPSALSIQSEMIFIHQLSLYLLILKSKQPQRDIIYYVGGRHHYFILNFANIFANNPFHIIYRVPERGLVGYSESAKILVEDIKKYKNSLLIPKIKEISLEKHIKSRGRYTNRRFWKIILMMSKEKEIPINICGIESYKKGFNELYEFPLSISIKPQKIQQQLL